LLLGNPHEIDILEFADEFVDLEAHKFTYVNLDTLRRLMMCLSPLVPPLRIGLALNPKMGMLE
jgi:hypothetical protein